MKFPEDESEDIENMGSEERKMPDFIYVEGKEGYREESRREFQYEFDPAFQKMAAQEYPLVLRVFCLFLSAIIFCVTAFAFAFFLLFLFVNLVTLFQLDQFWHQTKRLWEKLKKLFVSGFGLAVAVISPAFGFSMILLYLILKGAATDEDWMARIMKQRFYQ